MKYIDDLLNKITMYRLVTYGLGVIAAAGVLLALAKKLPMEPAHLVAGGIAILAGAYIANKIFSRLWDVPTNSESWLISGLILFLILQPPAHGYQVLVLGLAGAVSSASKFILAWRGKHIFNPAALAAALFSLTGIGAVSWWVGSVWLWPLTFVIGLAVVRKIRRFPMWIAFITVAVVIQLVIAGHSPSALHSIFLSSPLIFLSTIMLVEPATMPPRLAQQISFAGIIAVLYATGWNIGALVVYPEVALLLGNIYAYAVSPKFRWRLVLKQVNKVSGRVSDFVFTPDRPMKFLPGQYMEWTLAGVPYDNRGNRRTFTVASSPTESEVRLGLKFYEPSSSYKQKLGSLRPGDVVYASQLAGNFTLKGHEGQKLVFVAGGIGITPFRSMVKYLSDTERQFDAVLFYLLSDPAEEAYGEEFAAAHNLGLRYLPISSRAEGNVRAVEFNAKFLAGQVPDYRERTFYVSGPHPMVESTRAVLRALGVPRRRIKTDHFSGY